MMTRIRRLAPALAAAAALASGLPARADLDAYVKQADPAYRWELVKTEKTPVGNFHRLNLTSQEWHGITWSHALSIVEPAEVKYPDAVLLFITGGSNPIDPAGDRGGDRALGIAMARACGAKVAVLPQVPNQPLLPDKKEDDLITETFLRYLDTKDESWPLLFPMVKSAVKAMDAVQEWAKKEGKPEVKRFVVTGASKRGWTTWLTGATRDPRVVAIAPMVIDTLNMKAQTRHSLDMWGKFSEQIEDYTRKGLVGKFDDPVGEKLWKMVDPYSYRDRLTVPKLIINGTNDRYWTVDALNLYWGDLKGPKSVVYLPNAGHNLAVNRDYAINGVGALFRHTLSNKTLPAMDWEHGDDGNGTLTLTVKSSQDPKSAKLWVAKSDSLDFRDSKWEPIPMAVSGALAKGETPRPAKGHVALVGDVEYEIDGIPFHLSTQVRHTGTTGSK